MIAMELDLMKRSFLESVYLSNSINAALGHSGTYKHEDELPPKENGRPDRDGPDIVGDAFRKKICELATQYKNKVSGEQHIKNIEELRKSVSDSCGAYLREGCPRFGVAAKALSVYLKFLWCAGLIEEPPHCPFDRKVIEKLNKLKTLSPKLRDLSWTQMDDTTYADLAKEASARMPDKTSLAHWELQIWPAGGCSNVGS